MVVQRIRNELLAIPEVASWPDLVALIELPTARSALPCWEHPLLACRAVGGTEDQALPGAAAIFCLVYSMHLVDDILDQEPEGLQHSLGEGKVANLALAFQVAASMVIERSNLSARRRSAIHRSLAETAFMTAYGQHLDAGELSSEGDYWRVVEAKTPPLFGAALFIGALFGGWSEREARKLGALGFSIGKGIQVSDDLKDAFEKPAQRDWYRRHNNLPILYAISADHPEREEFIALLDRIDDAAALEKAQEILIRCGALSFCVYHLLELHRAGQAELRRIPLVDAKPIADLLDHYARPVKGLLRTVGVQDLDLGGAEGISI